MAKHKTLARRIAQLEVERSAVIQHEITLETGEIARLTTRQIIKGFQDSCTGIRSYESYVYANATNTTSAYAQKWLSMWTALTHPVDTSQNRKENTST